MTTQRKSIYNFSTILLLMTAIAIFSGCAYRDARKTPPRTARDGEPRVYNMEVTAYCPCGICCGWERNWWGRPVYSSGPQKGQRKRVGITASGTRARPGVIAADTDIFPFGTVMYVPGYGYGVVEDRGGAIRGHRIDLFYRTHDQALEWGRQNKRVKVWTPSRR